MHDYEFTLIFNPEVGEDNLPAAIDRVKGWISGSGGEVVKVASAGRKRLAFSIKKSRDGSFVYLSARMKPEALPEFERNLKLSDDVLRHMVIKR